VNAITFHCDVSTSDALEVSVDGEMATKDQLAAILRALNSEFCRTAIRFMANEMMEQPQ
jgi:hypothetical protein